MNRMNKLKENGGGGRGGVGGGSDRLRLARLHRDAAAAARQTDCLDKWQVNRGRAVVMVLGENNMGCASHGSRVCSDRVEQCFDCAGSR